MGPYAHELPAGKRRFVAAEAQTTRTARTALTAEKPRQKERAAAESRNR
jgi:hypothetical protein